MQMQIWAVFLSANFLQAAYFLQVSLHVILPSDYFILLLRLETKLN